MHASVVEARRALDRAEDALGLLAPRPVVAAPLGGPGEDELRALARRLRTPDPDPQPQLESDLRAAELALASGESRAGLPWMLAAVAAAVAAVAAFAMGQSPVGIVLGLLAIGLGAWAWLGRRGPAGMDRVERARAALAPTTVARDAARAEREAAAEAARAAGLPADPDELDRRANAVAVAARAAREAAAWDATRADLDERRARSEASLRDALRARRVAADATDLLAALASYEAACRQRAEQARLAGDRVALERALATRREAEAAAAETERSVARAEHALRTVAADVGLAADGAPDDVAAALGAWRLARGVEAASADAARREWHELQSLLDGLPVEQVQADALAAAARAAALAAKVDASELSVMAPRDDLGSLLEIEREELDRARADASTQRGALAEMQRDLPDVAEAEEAVAEAGAEQARVVGLLEVLTETTRLLRAAEERVHRDLAPILAAAITRWLPRVSGGAYVDASVDPADLSVRVKEAKSGRWRSALLLSEGTREQIYLLLRVAMAQQLATTGETAPLLLDEVTVQADAERKQQLLGVLHELSAERQIILFTHDDDVIGWAARALDGSRDRLVQLRAAAHAPQPALG